MILQIVESSDLRRPDVWKLKKTKRGRELLGQVWGDKEWRVRLKVGGSSFVPALVKRCIDGKFQIMGSDKTIPRGKVHMPLCSRVAPTSKELSKLASLARNVVMYTGRELMWQSCLVVDVANIGTKFLTRQMKNQNHRGTEPTKH